MSATISGLQPHSVVEINPPELLTTADGIVLPDLFSGTYTLVSTEERTQEWGFFVPGEGWVESSVFLARKSGVGAA
jgi:hypothetical protein